MGQTLGGPRSSRTGASPPRSSARTSRRARARAARRHAPGSASRRSASRACGCAGCCRCPASRASSSSTSGRTCGRGDGKPGIWFFSLDASSRLAVEAARRGTSSRTSTRGSRSMARTAGRRRVRAARRARQVFCGRYRPAGAAFHARAGLARVVPHRALLPLRGGRAAGSTAPRSTTRRGLLRPAEAEIELTSISPVELARRGRSATSPRARTSSLAARADLAPLALRALVSAAAPDSARFRLRRRRADRAQARHGARDAQPRPHLGGGPLRHRPRRRAAHLLRGRRRRPAGRRRTPVRARQGGASRGARGGGDPRAREPLHRRGARSRRLAARAHPQPCDAAWCALVVMGVVIVVDVEPHDRLAARAARSYDSAALASNALHFASDLAGSVAVLVGLLLARAGHAEGRRGRRALRRGARARRRGAADARATSTC